MQSGGRSWSRGTAVCLPPAINVNCCFIIDVVLTSGYSLSSSERVKRSEGTPRVSPALGEKKSTPHQRDDFLLRPASFFLYQHVSMASEKRSKSFGAIRPYEEDFHVVLNRHQLGGS